jgi:hypothetical protein
MKSNLQEAKGTRDKRGRRAFRGIVWGGRAVGWILIALAIVSATQTGPLSLMGGGVRLLASLALALLGVVWVIGLELFLRFFDRYLSRN